MFAAKVASRGLYRPVLRLSSHVARKSVRGEYGNALVGPSRLSIPTFTRAMTTETVASQTDPTPPPPGSKPKNPDGLFEMAGAGWDHVFQGIDTHISPLNTSNMRKRPPTRRHTMTAREISAFDEMFHMIFNAVSEQKEQNGVLGSSIGSVDGSKHIEELASQLREARNVQWSTEAEQDLDRKKEQMNLCTTDIQLLDWAMEEVFGESKRFEEAARKAAQDPSAPKVTQLQPSSYPHLVAALMRTFRDKYADPHLALAIFDHARYLSVPSFVFGCTTPAYNELIETRWMCFRDVRGVLDALEEMRVNGIEMNSRTKSLAEAVRSQVGQRTVWEESNDIGTNDVRDVLRRIEQLVAPPDTSKRYENWSSKKWTPRSESWKSTALQPSSTNDSWEFGKWDFEDSHPRRESMFWRKPRRQLAYI